MLQLTICPECSRAPVADDAGESAHWCAHSGVLILTSKATGARMAWSDITPDELPQILAFIGNARRGATVREAMRATPRTTPH